MGNYISPNCPSLCLTEGVYLTMVNDQFIILVRGFLMYASRFSLSDVFILMKNNDEDWFNEFSYLMVVAIELALKNEVFENSYSSNRENAVKRIMEFVNRLVAESFENKVRMYSYNDWVKDISYGKRPEWNLVYKSISPYDYGVLDTIYNGIIL